MVSTHEEIEVKYELEPGLDLPALPALLRALPEAAERGYREGDLGEFDLEATYFDTVDLCLSAARTTLRRRTGGTDAGWHLKTPGDAGARVEQRLPLGRAVRTVPAALRSREFLLQRFPSLSRGRGAIDLSAFEAGAAAPAPAR